jgi:hypothetical protein
MSAVLPIMFGLAAGAVNECPASLDLHVRGLSAVRAATVQAYADCVSQPWLPMSDTRTARIAQCTSQRLNLADKKVAYAVAWVEQMATNFAGCETRLEIKTR